MVHSKLLADATYSITGPRAQSLNPSNNIEATTMLERIVSQLIGVLTIVGVVFFAIQIILAGYGFMSSDGDEKKMEANRSKLTNSVLGLVIIVVAVGIGSLISKLIGLENPLDINKMFNLMGLTQ